VTCDCAAAAVVVGWSHHAEHRRTRELIAGVQGRIEGSQGALCHVMSCEHIVSSKCDCGLCCVMAGAEEACAKPRGGPEKPDEEEGDHPLRKLEHILILLCMAFHPVLLLRARLDDEIFWFRPLSTFVYIW